MSTTPQEPVPDPQPEPVPPEVPDPGVARAGRRHRHFDEVTLAGTPGRMGTGFAARADTTFACDQLTIHGFAADERPGSRPGRGATASADGTRNVTSTR
jgi:hypothetical protein